MAKDVCHFRTAIQRDVTRHAASRLRWRSPPPALVLWRGPRLAAITAARVRSAGSSSERSRIRSVAVGRVGGTGTFGSGALSLRMEKSPAPTGIARRIRSRPFQWPSSSSRCIVCCSGFPAPRAKRWSELKADKRVLIVQPLSSSNRRQLIAGARDRCHGFRRSPARLQSNVSALDKWRRTTSRGAGIRVAIIDTVSTPSRRRPHVRHRNFIDNDDVAFRSDRHGTQVADLSPPHRRGVGSSA